MTPEEISMLSSPPTEEQKKMVEELGVPTPIKEPVPESVTRALKYIGIFSEFRKFDHVLTLSNAAASRRSEIRKARCILFRPIDSYVKEGTGKMIFIRGPIFTGSSDPLRNWDECTTITMANHYLVDEIVNHRALVNPHNLIGILNPDCLSKEPKQRRWSIEDKLSITILELARVAPLNPTLRSHLQVLFKSSPPLECDTYEKLRDWMEYEFDTPSFKGRLRQYALSLESKIGAAQPTQARERVALTVRTLIHASETGTVTYIRPLFKTCSSNILERVISDKVSNGYSFDHIVQYLMNIAMNVDIESEGEKDPCAATLTEYVDYQSEDIKILDKNVNLQELESNLFDYMIRRYGKEEAQALRSRI